MNKKIVIVNKNFASYKPEDEDLAFYTASSAEGAGHLIQHNPVVIALAGGDGTLSATLNDVLFRNPDFLNGKFIQILAKGSGNDRIKALTELCKAGNYISVSNPLDHKGKSRIITDDFLLATINGKYKRYVFNAAGIGLDSQTLIEYEGMRSFKIPASLKYFSAATTAISRLNGYKGLVEYSTAQRPVQSAEPVMFLFMLGKYFGGGMPINSRMAINDGKFESLILNRGTNLKLYSSLISISLLKQSQYHNPVVKYLCPAPGLKLEVMSTDKFYFESDGEILTDNNVPVEVRSIEIGVAGKITYLLDGNQ